MKQQCQVVSIGVVFVVEIELLEESQAWGIVIGKQVGSRKTGMDNILPWVQLERTLQARLEGSPGFQAATFKE